MSAPARGSPSSGLDRADGAGLVAGLVDLLPGMQPAELKVTIAAIYATVRAGCRSVAISLSEFQALTGLGRSGVMRGIRTAVKRGTIRRTQAAGTYIYTLALRSPGLTMGPAPGPASEPIGPIVGPISNGMEPIGPTEIPHDMYACSTYPLKQESSHATGPAMGPEPADLIREMRDLGVALKVCQNIAGRYDGLYVLEKLRHTRYAIAAGLAQNPAGWFVAAVKNDWPAPHGYDEDAHLTDEERRMRYISGEYGHLIQH